MRYLNIHLLKKHFESSSSNKITTYLVVVPNVYEKEKIFSYILKKINTKKFNLSKFSKDFKLSDIINAFQSPSLLGGEPLVLIDDLANLAKQDILNLNEFVKNNDVNLIIGSLSKTQISALYATVDKKGVVFDLTTEKIWEKEKRLVNFLVEKCNRAKKNISSIVIEALLEKVGLDLAILEQEIDKLITYVGNKLFIELADVHSICPVNVTDTVWQKAEEIVWGKINFDSISIDASYFHLLLAAIRYQLQLGCKIASLLENNKTQDISGYFPKIYPKALEKKKEIAMFYKTTFYKKAIKDLFEIDLLSKTVSFDFSYLLDLLKTKLLYLSTYDVNSTT